MQKRSKVIAIVGPTSSGKTSLGIWLAKQIQKEFGGAEIISADSRQVYKGLDIGTGKVTKKEMAGVPHHLLSVASPKKVFSASDFKKLGEQAIRLIYQSNHVPIVVGGTGLYADVLLGRMLLPEVSPNKKLRERLERLTTRQLFARLEKADPERARNIEPGHKQRIIRALEIAAAIGKSPPKEAAMHASEQYDVLWLGLDPGVKQLQKNIHIRLFARIRAGMVAEAKKLHKKGLSYNRMRELGLEYRFLADYLENKVTRPEMERGLESAINKYAKRQMRWFKRNKDIHWLTDKTEAIRFVKAFMKKKRAR